MTLSQCQPHEGSPSHILSDSPQSLWHYHSAIPLNMTPSQCHQVKKTSQTKRKAPDVGNLWHLMIGTKQSRGLRPQIKRANQESDQHAMLAVQTNSAPHQSKVQIVRFFLPSMPIQVQATITSLNLMAVAAWPSSFVAPQT